jgi:hypothetical protein
MNDIGHYGLGHGIILARPKIVDPPGECWPDLFKHCEDNGLQTPTRKEESLLSTAEKSHLKPLPEFTGLPEEDGPGHPLILISAKSRYYLLSSYR